MQILVHLALLYYNFKVRVRVQGSQCTLYMYCQLMTYDNGVCTHSPYRML